MLLRTSRVVIEVLVAVLLGSAVLLAASAWRLSSGPLSLSFLTPSIEEALNRRELPFAIKLSDTVLAWSGWRRPLDIRVLDVRAIGADGTIIASVPQVSLSLSVGALLRGDLAPTRIGLIEPRLRLVRSASGAFQLAIGDSGGIAGQTMERLKTALRQTPEGGGVFGRLKRISVVNGRLRVDDRLNGVVWRVPGMDFSLTRQGMDLTAVFDSEVEVGGRLVRLAGTATYRTKTETIVIDTAIDGFRPDLLSEKLPDLKSWSALQQTISGQVSAEIDGAGRVQKAKFDLTGSEGRIMLPGLWAKGLPVKSLLVRGRLQQGPQLVIIDEFMLGVGAAGGAASAGPSLTGNGVITWIGGAIALNGETVLHDMPIADLDRFWPRRVGKSPRAWVTTNMTTGVIDEIRVRISANAGNNGSDAVVIESMTGTMRFSGANVHYLRPLPPGTDLDATAVFTRDKFIITLSKGRVGGLRADSGIFRFTKLDTDQEHAQIELVLRGPLKDTFALLDHPKLKYAAGLGVDTVGAAGESATRLVLSFPSYAGLTVDEVQFAAAANLRDVRLRNVMMGHDLSEGALTLRVDRKGMEVKGRAKIGTAPFDISWYEDFTGQEKFRSRYEIKGTIGDRERRSVGLDFPPYLSGPVGLDIAFLEDRKGRGEVAVKLALKDAVLSLPVQDWTKKAGTDGIAWMTLIMQDRRPVEIRNFDIRTSGLAMAGRVRLSAPGQPWRADLRRFKLGATDLAGTIAARADGGFDVSLRGAFLDASKFLNLDGDADTGREIELPQMSLDFDIKRVLIDKGRVFDQFKGKASHGPDGWRSASLNALLDKGHRVGLRISSSPELRKFDLVSSNAGVALDAFDVFKNVKGGTLDLSAVRAIKLPGSPWRGRLRLSDFRIVKAPLLTRVMALASLPGIVDTLSGRGITFTRMEMPFILQDKVLKIVKARSVGPALGLRVSGEINFATDRVKLNGTIVPAYTINSVLGYIPIIGRLLTGKDKTGLFAASFSIEGPREKAIVTVNPLTALAPGFLRDLIGGLLGEGEKAITKKPAPER